MHVRNYLWSLNDTTPKRISCVRIGLPGVDSKLSSATVIPLIRSSEIVIPELPRVLRLCSVMTCVYAIGVINQLERESANART